MRRYLSPIYPGPRWTDEEIDEDLKRTMEEMHNIASDDSIARYDKPNVEDLTEIIQKAKEYTGPWYHSEVTLPEWFISEEYSLLQKEVEELGQNAGIVIKHEMASSSEVEGLLEKLFQEKNNK